MAKILSVSYDEALLQTRRMLLEAYGYDVISALGFTESLQHCNEGKFDLFVLGHSIPRSDKRELIRTFHEQCSAPIISLRKITEEPVDGADFYIEPDPEPLLQLIRQILDRSNMNASS